MITKTKFWLTTSVLVMTTCLIVIIAIRPVWGIDFTGGSLLEVSSENIDSMVLHDFLKKEFNLDSSVQTSEKNTFLIRTLPLDQEQRHNLTTSLVKNSLITEELRFESIGPTIGSELRKKAIVAVGLAVIAMIVYLAYTFRATAGLIKSWKFGVAAAVALVHDLLAVMALFVILGKTNGVVIDTLFVSAMLAILGYSVNDTIVLFNRIKEKWLATRTGNLLTIMDEAVKATLVRSLNTSITTLLVLTTLIILGGNTIHWFAVALAAGTIVGTYSSLFVAPSVLYYLAKR